MRLGYNGNIMLGEAPLAVTNSYKYLGHIITDNLSDEADLEDKERGLYRRCNVLLRTFHFCSEEVKNKLFTCYWLYCSNVYLCQLWVKFRKSCMHHFIVSYNNAFRILLCLPMRCSASGMFASSGVNSCQTLIRRSVYSLQCWLHASLNSILRSTVEPLTNDHSHQRPSLSYDHISCIRIPHERPSLLYDHTNVILRVVV